MAPVMLGATVRTCDPDIRAEAGSFIAGLPLEPSVQCPSLALAGVRRPRLRRPVSFHALAGSRAQSPRSKRSSRLRQALKRGGVDYVFKKCLQDILSYLVQVMRLPPLWAETDVHDVIQPF